MSKASSPLPALHPVRLICTWFGAGLSPVIPGTVGSLAALPFAFLIQHYWGQVALLAAAVGLFFIGWWAAHAYLLAANNPEDADPREVVVDEVVGQWLLLSALPPTPLVYALAFFLFRFFDIFKPWPVSVPDRKMKTGLGIMLDDVLAGAYPVILLLIISTVCTLMGKQHLMMTMFSWLVNG